MVEKSIMALWKREKAYKFQRTDQHDFMISMILQKKKKNARKSCKSHLHWFSLAVRKRHPASFDIPFVLPNLLQHKVKQ